MSRNRSCTDERGMTLAEVLVAMAIVAIGLVAVSQAIPIAAYGIQEGSQKSTATFLANQRLEQVRNAQWAVTPAADTVGVSPSSGVAPQAGGVPTFPDEGQVAAPYAAYARQVRISDCGVAPGCAGLVKAGMRQVTVAVSFRPLTARGQAAAGSTESVVLSTYVAQR